MAHRVRTHRWKQGRLEVKDAFFEILAEALAFAHCLKDADSIKVFGHKNQLIHDIHHNEDSSDSYA